MGNINVMSLFDGMSGGRLALAMSGITVQNYFSSEIDKNAIKIADKNFPQDTKNRLGSVLDLSEEQLLALPKIDLLIGGSPCQGFSMAGTKKGSATEDGIEVTTLKQYLDLKANGFKFGGQSYLFWEYMRVYEILKPKYFFLENVRITKKWLPMFNDTLGVDPIEINSSVLVPQNRVRFYWSNIPNLSVPKNTGTVLSDIIQDIHEIKTNNIDTSLYTIPQPAYKEKSLDFINKMKDGEFYPTQLTSSRNFGNSISDNTVGYCLRASTPNGIIVKNNGKSYWRRITQNEAELMQAVPVGYTDGIALGPKYHMLGNGWTINVISHLFNGIK